MEAKALWQEYVALNPRVERIGCNLWPFEQESLIQAMMNGEKTATATAYALYGVHQEVPVAGEFAMIVDAQGEGRALLKFEQVYVVPFYRINEAFAQKSGFKDLNAWKESQIPHLTRCLNAIGSNFNEGVELLCIEFRKVYPNESQI